MVLADIVPIEVRNAWETARWEKEIGNLFQEMMTNGQGWAKCYSDDEGCVSLVNLPFDYYTRMYGWELERRVEAATPDVVEWPRQAWVWLLPGNGWLVGQF